MESLENAILENSYRIRESFQKDIDIINKSYDLQFQMYQLYITVVINNPYANREEFTSLVLTSLFKNNITLYSAFDLTLKGLYGSARMLFRYVFENLIIAKYISINNDPLLLKKWENGDDISLRKDIFKHIKEPNSLEIKELWKTLCSYTHGTIFSQQVDFSFENIQNDVAFNFVCMKMFLDMNYHVLNTHATNPSIKYYAKEILDLHQEGLFDNNRKEIRLLINEIRRSLQPHPRKIVKDFASTWALK